ncbi:MAG TPA: AgmX/PglI C-terminal domain-containing protein, partial [Polyangiaceae bacterium]
DDELASRMHAVMEVASPADVTLIDLGNEPGTLVNGHRVNKCKVRQGDQIQIGSTLIVLETVEAVAAAPPIAEAAPWSNPFTGANPFAAPPALFVAQAAAASTDSEGNAFSYSMVKSGPDVSSDEVEVAHRSAIEVMILWGSNVLHVSHLAPTSSFHVGEELGGEVSCDYFIPGETLGTTRAPIVVSRGGAASLVILPRSGGAVDIPGQGKVSLADLVSSGRAHPSTEMAGAYEYELPPGAKARMELDGSALVFQVSAVNAGKRVPVGLLATSEPAAFLYTGLSFVLHMGLVAVFAFFLPGMRGDDSEAIDRDRILLMQKLINAAQVREELERDTPEVSEAALDQKEGGTGARAKDEEGSMGNPNTRDTGHRYGIQGPRDNPDPHLAKQAALTDAARFGMIGLIATMGGGDPNAPTAPWGREESSGTDEKSARGNMFGDAIGDSFGAGGLGLSGVGEGGGGRGEGIGIGEFGLGHGAGTGSGQGIGGGRDRLRRGHAVRAPHMRDTMPNVNGRLPPEVIQRIVRQNFGRFRLCYENSLRNNPNLQGRVTVKFVIDRSGAVGMTADGGSDIPDSGVVQCVVRGFGNLSFPQPEGGMVTVVYPILFNPGD